MRRLIVGFLPSKKNRVNPVNQKRFQMSIGYLHIGTMENTVYPALLQATVNIVLNEIANRLIQSGAQNASPTVSEPMDQEELQQHHGENGYAVSQDASSSSILSNILGNVLSAPRLRPQTEVGKNLLQAIQTPPLDRQTTSALKDQTGLFEGVPQTPRPTNHYADRELHKVEESWNGASTTPFNMQKTENKRASCA